MWPQILADFVGSRGKVTGLPGWRVEGTLWFALRGLQGEAVFCELEGNQEPGAKKPRRWTCFDTLHPSMRPDSEFLETGEKFHKMSWFSFSKTKIWSSPKKLILRQPFIFIFIWFEYVCLKKKKVLKTHEKVSDSQVLRRWPQAPGPWLLTT